QYSYSAEADYKMYLHNRQNCGRRPKWLTCDSFTIWDDDKMLNKGWSPDVVVGRAANENLFTSVFTSCTSTLYHRIERGIMKTKNSDLLEKISRKQSNIDPKE